MVMWLNGLVTVPVRWFFAPDTARVLPYPTVYCSSNWDDVRDQSPLGEQYPRIRAYERGQNVEGYTGERFCGPPQAWTNGGLLGVTPSITTDADGYSTCCGRANQAPTIEGGWTPRSWQWRAPRIRSGFGLLSSQGITLHYLYHGLLTWSASSTGTAVQGGYYGGRLTWSASSTGTAAWSATYAGRLTWSASSTGTAVAEGDVPYVGEYRWMFGATPPTGWVLCDGSGFSSVTYPSLAALLGDTFRAHSGTTYYQPDARGHVLVAAGSYPGLTPRSVGSGGGQETVTLTDLQSGLPAHTHPPPSPGTAYVVFDAGAVSIGAASGVNAFEGSDTGSAGGTPAAASHENMQPWECVGNLFIYGGP